MADAPSTATNTPPQKQRIRIRLKAYDHKVIDQSAKQMADIRIYRIGFLSKNY